MRSPTTTCRWWRSRRRPAALKEGGTATFTLTRAGDLAVPLSVPVRVGELGAFLSGTAPSPVAFAAGAATAAFAVATEDDAVDEADGAVTAEIIGGDGHRAGAAARATVAVADDDVRGVRILETALTIREGGSGLCPVVLTSEPTAPVTFSAVMPAGAEITMAPPALRFTPANWSQKQVVTVRALHDADAVADDPLVLAHTVKGGDYEGLAAPVVTVTITEDDVSGVKVSETALTLAEGDAGTYTVVLDTEAGRRGDGGRGGTRGCGDHDGPFAADLHDGDLEHGTDGDGDRDPGRRCRGRPSGDPGA